MGRFGAEVSPPDGKKKKTDVDDVLGEDSFPDDEDELDDEGD